MGTFLDGLLKVGERGSSREDAALVGEPQTHAHTLLRTKLQEPKNLSLLSELTDFSRLKNGLGEGNFRVTKGGC